MCISTVKSSSHDDRGSSSQCHGHSDHDSHGYNHGDSKLHGDREFHDSHGHGDYPLYRAIAVQFRSYCIRSNVWFVENNSNGHNGLIDEHSYIMSFSGSHKKFNYFCSGSCGLPFHKLIAHIYPSISEYFVV